MKTTKNPKHFLVWILNTLLCCSKTFLRISSLLKSDPFSDSEVLFFFFLEKCMCLFILVLFLFFLVFFTGVLPKTLSMMCPHQKSGANFIFYLFNCSSNLTMGTQTFASAFWHAPETSPASSFHRNSIEVKENLAADVRRLRADPSRSVGSYCSWVMLGTCAEAYAAFQYGLWDHQRGICNLSKSRRGQTCSKVESEKFGSLLTQETEYVRQKKKRQKRKQFEVRRANSGIMTVTFHNSSFISNPFLSILSHVPSRYSR